MLCLRAVMIDSLDNSGLKPSWRNNPPQQNPKYKALKKIQCWILMAKWVETSALLQNVQRILLCKNFYHIYNLAVLCHLVYI